MALSGYGGEELLDCPLLWDDPSGTFNELSRTTRELRRRWSIPCCAFFHFNQVSQKCAPFAGNEGLNSSVPAGFCRNSPSRSCGTSNGRNGLDAVCLGGGVAQNCVAAAKLYERFRGRVYVSPVPGDVGQPLGNALWARAQDSGTFSRIPEEVFLGPKRDLLAEAMSVASPASSQPEDLAAYIADQIFRGRIVGLCIGRSEFGARALGHRSVLCDPCHQDAVSRVKIGVKRRDEFMPLAPVVLASLVTEAGLPHSHTMSLAPRVPEALHHEFGAAVHVDGTARIQVAYSGSFVQEVLSEFHALSGRRVLINTSFNRRGQPIAETGADGVQAFHELDVDLLVVEGTVFTK